VSVVFLVSLFVVVFIFFFFFFQAEDGIRDGHVTGVQTCALPIWIGRGRDQHLARLQASAGWIEDHSGGPCVHARGGGAADQSVRSEERRVGKECRSRGAREQ